jgi:MFS family permease
MTVTATPARAGAGRAVPAHRDGNVLRWLGAYTASMLGDGVYFVALAFAAAKAAPPAEVGMVMAAGSVPRAALMLGGGVIADRFGPRRVVIGSDAARCLLILGAAAALALTSPGLWLLVALALLFGVVDALFMPAVGALPPRLVAGDQLTRLQGMRALVIRFGTVVGPPAGGVAMGLGGAAAAFALAGALFAVSVPLLAGTRIGGPAPAVDRPARGDRGSRGSRGSRRSRGELRAGLRYIRRHPLLAPLVVSGAVSELGLIGPLNVGMILLCQDRGWGSAGYGWIIACFGAGAAAGALLLTVRGWLPRAGAVQIGTLLLSSAGVGCIALTPSLPAAAALALGTGVLCGICGGIAAALIQGAADHAYLGRITSVTSLTSMGLAPLAYPLFGAAVAAAGPAPVFLASAALGACGGAVGLLSPAVRTARLTRPAGSTVAAVNRPADRAGSPGGG